MELFDEMPLLESDRLILRELDERDAPALDEIAHDPAVLRFLPTFLYEQTSSDVSEAIRNMRAECFDTKTSIHLAICLRDDPDHMLGIAEIYNYDPEARKASVGCRLLKDSWHHGVATETARMLLDYLLDQLQLTEVTAHVMSDNTYSGQSLIDGGFVKVASGLQEDWGRGELVTADKYVAKRLPK